jgi:hypothetical protein
MKLYQNRFQIYLIFAKFDKLYFIYMSRRILKRKFSDLKRILHLLNENEEMTVKIDLAVVKIIK